MSKLGNAFLQHFATIELHKILGNKQLMKQHLMNIITKHMASMTCEGTELKWSVQDMFTFPVKLLICELLGSEEQKQLRNFISPLMNIAQLQDAPKYGIFHTGTSVAIVTLFSTIIWPCTFRMA